MVSDNDIKGAESLLENYQEGDFVGKPLIANFLYNNGITSELQESYDRLGRGGDLYLPTDWEKLQYAVKWIKAANGTAIIAHPGTYQISKAALDGLFREFKEAGGDAIEICYGPCSDKEIKRWSHYAQKFDLHGSVGSDFHKASKYCELGRIKKLPKHIKPVWELF